MGVTKKVVVCGSRDWIDRKKVYDRLLDLPEGTVIIEGGARGADTIAREVAKQLGMKVTTVYANWDLHGKKAGPIRNSEMLAMKPDLVIAFHENLEESLGTADTVRKAKALKIPVDVVR